MKIYGLKLDDTGEIFYVGKTIRSLEARFLGHKQKAMKGEHYSQINDWFQANRPISIILLDETDDPEAETKWYEKLLESQPLVNRHPTIAWKTHTQRLGRSHSVEAKEKIRQSKIGKHLSNDHRKSISDTLSGREMPENEKAKRRGKTHSKETKEKMRSSHIGHFVSQETRDKMSKKKKGYKYSPEKRATMNQWFKGRPLSEEHKQKIRDAAKRRRENKSKLKEDNEN